MTPTCGLRVTRPGDCAFAAAIPTTREAFYADKHSPGKDFVRNCCSTWPKYQHDVIRPFQRTEREIRGYGVRVIRDLTFDSFVSLCADEKMHVIILFAHWKGSAIEFFDGLKESEDIVRRVMPPISCILDLCACHPDRLALPLGGNSPDSIVRFSEGESIPSIWLAFYRLLFNILDGQSTAYLDAFELAARSLLRKEQ